MFALNIDSLSKFKFIINFYSLNLFVTYKQNIQVNRLEYIFYSDACVVNAVVQISRRTDNCRYYKDDNNNNDPCKTTLKQHTCLNLVDRGDWRLVISFSFK